MSSAGRSTRSGREASAPTDTLGLGTTRARIVGARTGVLADTVVAVVRAARAVGRAGQQLADRLGSVVTPLGPLGLDWAYGFDRTALDPVTGRLRPDPKWQLHFKLSQLF